jgi:4-hydroxythreonine-4-phosphate dehydrogenase
VNVIGCWDETLEISPGKASKETGKASYIALKQACDDLKDGSLDALVTAPIDKHSIHREEFPFAGHTEFLTKYFEANDSLMFMVSESLRVGLVTEHIPVRDIAQSITKEKIESKLRIMEQSLRQDFGIQKPKIAVLGLNPHAGDNGLIGKEDDELIKPILTDAKSKGKLVFGPFPADGFFASGNYKKYDAVLATIRDWWPLKPSRSKVA